VIVTFYSFKGGTGRTMALANIAILLARTGARVLAVDFDLEAPGLWRFFRHLERDLGNRHGLLDLLVAQSENRSETLADWHQYVIPVTFDGGTVSLITSGRSDDGYPARVLGFDWQKFFRDSDGGSFIEHLRAEWAGQYDFTLIDSRTGITDTGGVCTIALPDLIVPVFAANHQNIEGILEVLKRAQEGRQHLAYDRSPALVLPVLSRFDSRTEHESANEWLDLVAERFSNFYADWLPGSIAPRKILERTKLPYVGFYSFGEKLPVMDPGITDPESLGYALNSVARLIESHLGSAAALAAGAGTSMPDRSAGGLVPVLSMPSAAGRTAAAIMGGVPPQNPNFTGRERMLQELRMMLRQAGRPAALPHTLQGLGGVGKSQIAAEYARRFQSDYEIIWWIPSDYEISIRRAFLSLARRLGLPESEDVMYTVETVLDQLRVGRPSPDWLLIYDGAGEPGALRKYLPSGSGQVLITSRNQSWINHSTVIEVDVFTADESAAFLARRWAGIGHEDAAALAERLGHLPLALEQAVAVHTETGMPLAEYFRLLEASPGRVLDEGETGDYQQSVAQTWRLAFDQLSDQSLAAAQLLEVCSFLSSQPIAVPMLARGRGASLPAVLADALRDDLKMRSAVRDIGRFGLAQLDASHDSIKIHTLVRALLRDGLTAEQRAATERSAHELLALANPGTPDNNMTWSQHAQVAPHVIPSGVILSDDPHVRRIVLDQIRYFFAIGDYAASSALAARAVETWQGSLGPDDEMTLVANFHFGNALRALGDYERARDVNQETLRRMQLILTRDHEYTLRMANSHAADYRLLGDFHRARAIDEDNLERTRRILGDDDPATLRSANNLAEDHRHLGDYRRAREIDEETLRRRSAILGDYHPEVLSSTTHLICDLYGCGEYEQALTLEQESVASYEKRLPDHAFVLLAKRNLAILVRKTGRYAEAVRLSEVNLDLTRGRFGPRHEHSLSAMMTLSNALREFGDITRARTVCEEAHDLYQAQFGVDHPFTLACASNVAIVYRALGREAEAMAMAMDGRTLDALTRTLGADHPYALCSASNMSNNLFMLGRYGQARKMSERALDRSRQVRVPDHPHTLACAANFSLDLAATGAKAEAAELRKDTLERMRRRLGPEHPEIASFELGRRAECDIELPEG